MAKGERFGGRKGTAAFAWMTWGDIDGKKDFKDIFCVTHTDTHTSCFGSFMKDKGKSGNVLIYFYFPLGLSLETAGWENVMVFGLHDQKDRAMRTKEGLSKLSISHENGGRCPL